MAQLVKESTCDAADPGSGRSPGEGKGYPLQYSGLENSIDCIVRGVTKSQIGLSDFHFHFLREGLRDQPGRYMHTNQQPQYRLGASRGWMLADVQAERGRQSSGGIDLCAEF